MFLYGNTSPLLSLTLAFCVSPPCHFVFHSKSHLVPTFSFPLRPCSSSFRLLACAYAMLCLLVGLRERRNFSPPSISFGSHLHIYDYRHLLPLPHLGAPIHLSTQTTYIHSPLSSHPKPRTIAPPLTVATYPTLCRYHSSLTDISRCFCFLSLFAFQLLLVLATIPLQTLVLDFALRRI